MAFENMNYYNEDDYLPPASPPLLPIQPKLRKLDTTPEWEDAYDSDSDVEIDIDSPWHPALRDVDRIKKRPRDKNGNIDHDLHNKRASRKDAVLVNTMDPRLSWHVATEMGLVPPQDMDVGFDDKKNRRKNVRKRYILPIVIRGSSNEVTIAACPDSGSDENIMSLNSVNQLQLKIQVPGRKPGREPRRFALANGKTVEAIGEVSVKFSFGAGSHAENSLFTCIFQVFNSLAVPAIVGMGFLHQTGTLSKHRDRLVEELIPRFQSLRVNSVGSPQRNLVCRLGTYLGCATADTGSDLDLVSPQFAKPRAFNVRSAKEELEFADGSIGWTSGVIQTSFSVGSISDLEGFLPRGQSVDLDLYVLENLNADIILGQDTIDELDIFGSHTGSFIPSIPRLGESDVNIIRHIGSAERLAKKIWGKLKKNRKTEESSDLADSVADLVAQFTLEDQRENARREATSADIEKKTGSDKIKAQEDEATRIRKFEEERERRIELLSKPGTRGHSSSPNVPHPDTGSDMPPPLAVLTPASGELPPLQMDSPRSASNCPMLPSIRSTLGDIDRLPVSSPYYYGTNGRQDSNSDDSSSMMAETPSTDDSTSPATPATTPSIADRMTIDEITNPQAGSYVCTFAGCTAPAFQTRYLLNSHMNVHSSARPHYCPVKGCPRSVSGKGFKRRYEMIRHGLVHDSPGYVCPFCSDRENKYPRPDNLYRHVRVHHVDKDKDDPDLLEVLAQRPDGPFHSRRRRGPPL